MQEDKIVSLVNKLQAVLNSSTDYNIYISPTYEVLSFNEAAKKFVEKVYGKTIQEGQYILDYVLDSSVAEFKADFAKALEGEQVDVEKEISFETSFLWFKISFIPVYDGDKKLIGVTYNATNIDSRKRIEAKLKSSENKLRAMLDSTKDSNILVSPDFKILSINNTAKQNIEQFYGKSVEEGHDFWQYVVKGTEDEFKIDFSKALAGEYTQIEKEIHFEQKFSVWFEFSYFPAYDSSRRIIGVTFNTVNIDSRKRAEEELKRSEYILRAIYHSSTEANTFISPSYKILHFNKVAAEMSKEFLGFYPKIGCDYSDFFSPHLQEEIKSYFDRALQGETVEIEKAKGITWYRFIFFPVYDQEGTLTGVAANIKDITGRKNNELRIARQNEKLLAIAWQQAHGVRRPLANILGLINLIRAETDNSFLPTYINYLQVAADELDAIIHKIVNDTQDI